MGLVDQAAGLRATFEAKRACWGAEPRALVWQPAPPASGDPAQARRLAQGVLVFDGQMAKLAPGAQPWELDPPGPGWTDHLHGHGWLDDYAASQHAASRQILVAWVHGWIARFGQGTGPGWKPELAARRLIRWIAHAIPLLNGADSETSHAFFRTLSAHARFLDRRWRHTRPGIERIEALAGQVYARLSLERGMPAEDAIRLLGQTADALVDADGAIQSRNPQEALRVVEILGWSAGIIDAAGKTAHAGQLGALSRLIPTLQALCHSDGRLARFHGGRAGQPGAVARAIEAAPVGGARENRAWAMGYLRLSGGEASLLIDAADPPKSSNTAEPHASPLAIEFTHGAHPIFVNAGTGLGFGAEAEAEGRLAMAHSTLILGDGKAGPESIAGPVTARLTEAEGGSGTWAMGESRAWLTSHGLLHERRLNLASDGRKVSGEDTLLASSAADRARLTEAWPSELGPRRFGALFVIHPDAKVEPALNGRAALILLPDGAKWMLRTDSPSVQIRPGRYFEAARVRPRATKQIVVSGEILEYWGRITWSLDHLAGPQPV